MFYKSILTTAICTLISAPAFAQVSEIRVGITEFDEQTVKFGWGAADGRENSIGINGQIIFDEPEFLTWALSPQPYIGGMINLEGDTSYGGVGLLWRQNFSDKFYGDISIGVVLHNGTKKVFRASNFETSTIAELLQRDREEISFGSRYLFRPAATLGYRVNENWAGEVFFEHLSNGYTGNVNTGVDSIGFRAARRF